MSRKDKNSIRRFCVPYSTRVSALLLAPVFMVAAMCQVNALGQKPAWAKTTEGLPAGAMQAKATTSCTECHEARIILQQRLSKAAWSKEVDKMVKWGAVVDAGDYDALIDYLSTNFNPDQPPYNPPRTASERTDGTGAKKTSR